MTNANTTNIFAAIDIGTVTCRLFIAEVNPTGLKELERQCAITNLGIGVDATGMLAADAIERVVQQVAAYAQTIRSYGIPATQVRAVATSAARDARNADVLQHRLAEVGVTLQVIPGTQEAALCFAGASLGYTGRTIAVVDIGGGSTEIVVGQGEQAPLFAHSFNIGCRRVTERFYASNPPTQAQCHDARVWIAEEFSSVFAAIHEQFPQLEAIVAVAGTATSVVSINEHMEVYDSSRVHGTQVAYETLERIYNELRALPLAQREQVVGLEPKRAGVIVAGMAILLEVLSAAGASCFTVSESDILQGIVLHMAAH